MTNEIVQELQHHLDCPYYQNKDNPKFDIIAHLAGYELLRKTDMATLVYVIDGEIEFSDDSKDYRTARSNDLFMLPSDSEFTFRFIMSASLICFFIAADIDFCWRMRQKLSGYSMQTTNQNIVLPATDTIQKYISNFLIITDKGVLCVKYLDCQICTLIDLICVFYPSETLIEFFEPLRSYIFGRGLNFKQEVLKNRHKLFKVSQYAEALNMSRATFRRHFERVFEMNPHDWIHQERVKLVEQELKNSDLPLQQVALKTGFASIRDFYGFCKKNLGKTAVEIRKEGDLMT